MSEPTPDGASVRLAVVGAHLRGQPLNGELTALDARFLATGSTADCYRLVALNTTPPKPGLVRVAPHEGAAIEVEVWELSAAAFGRFVAAIPPPLGVGTVLLEPRFFDGAEEAIEECSASAAPATEPVEVPGFICEPFALLAAVDITAHGGWRAYRESLADA